MGRQILAKFKSAQKIMLAVFAVFAGQMAAVPPLSAQESRSELQPGYYIFLGMQPGRQAPKGFTVNSAGLINWQDPNKLSDDSSISSDLSHHLRNGKSAASHASPAPSEQIESYAYPMIKWKPKAVSRIPGAIVQLATTYEVNELKYKLTLFRAPTEVKSSGSSGVQETRNSYLIPSRVSVQLLDQNGFKLLEFSVGSNQWDQIPGTSVLEARDKISCNEWDYRRSRDYSVK